MDENEENRSWTEESEWNVENPERTEGSNDGEASTVETSNSEDGAREFIAPRPVKKMKKQNMQHDHSALLTSAVNILQDSAKRLSNSYANPEVQSFCAFLSSKMTSYSKLTRQKLQHSIYSLLIQADMGVFERTSPRQNIVSPSLLQSSPTPPHTLPHSSVQYSPIERLYHMQPPAMDNSVH